MKRQLLAGGKPPGCRGVDTTLDFATIDNLQKDYSKVDAKSRILLTLLRSAILQDNRMRSQREIEGDGDTLGGSVIGAHLVHQPGGEHHKPAGLGPQRLNGGIRKVARSNIAEMRR